GARNTNRCAPPYQRIFALAYSFKPRKHDLAMLARFEHCQLLPVAIVPAQPPAAIRDQRFGSDRECAGLDPSIHAVRCQNAPHAADAGALLAAALPAFEFLARRRSGLRSLAPSRAAVSGACLSYLSCLTQHSLLRASRPPSSPGPQRCPRALHPCVA